MASRSGLKRKSTTKAQTTQSALMITRLRRQPLAGIRGSMAALAEIVLGMVGLSDKWRTVDVDFGRL